MRPAAGTAAPRRGPGERVRSLGRPAGAAASTLGTLGPEPPAALLN
ncbi:MAG: hypothetical protein ACRDRJ_37310 [Streptosporangiaceae bacterium]